MIRTQIQLTDAQYEALKLKADQSNCSMAEVIRQAVDAWMLPTRLEQERQRALALSVIGRFKSGLTNFSETHDQYTFGEIE